MYNAKQVIYAKIENDILEIVDMHRERAYSSVRNKKSQISISCNIEDLKDLPKVIFSEMEYFIDGLCISDKRIHQLAIGLQRIARQYRP